MKKIISIILLLASLGANERVISLSPSITEIIYALNKGDTLVATSTYSLYPKAALSLPVIGGYENPRLEKVLSFKPSLVVGQTFNAKALKRLEHFGIKTLMLDLKSIENIKKSISILDKYINYKTDLKSKKLIKNIDDALENAHKFKNSTKQRVMVVYGLRVDLRSGIYIAGKNIFFNEIINECGAYNAYTSNSTNQPVLSYENVIALNPDIIIILHSHATESTVNVNEALASWSSIPTNASKHKRIYIVDEDYLHIPSHRIALTINKLCGVINDKD